MNDKHKLLVENPKNCRRLFGVEYGIFETILAKVQNSLKVISDQNPLSTRGLKSDFSVANQVLLTLEYLRQYPTFVSLAFSYGISESYANKIYHKIRPILAETIGLKNPEKLKFKHIQKVIVDVTVQPIERPKNSQEKYYNRYKKTYN